MNIFLLENVEATGVPDPVASAISQCDKHIVKMPLESAQMLSTAHRLLDGKVTVGPSKSGKRQVKKYILPDEREQTLYSAVHYKHPCTMWSCKTSGNYLWHLKHFKALCKEYTYRYGKRHKSEDLLLYLNMLPDNIEVDGMTDFPLAMGSNPECITDDPVLSYRMFYIKKQDRFEMKWTKRQQPGWFNLCY